MGIIEDGTISGNLPSSSKSFVVHYPGYPSSIERAVETLGGIEGILKVCTKKSNKLELHFRPEDPYSHPAFGELQPCNNFLLKISKKKVKSVINKINPDGSPEHASSVNLEQNNTFLKLSETSQKIVQPESEPPSDSSEVDVQTEIGVPEPLIADIVAQVSEAYHFNGMVDYQHVLAVHADNARRKKKIWDEVEPRFRKGGFLDHEDLMMLVPPLFSTKDLPENVVLKNRWKDICAFEVFPYKCQVLLQLFELKDDYVQQEIRKPSSQESCSLQTGWFSSHVIDCLRLRVAQRFLTVYPEAGAESILKSVSRRFERAKRMHISMKDLKGYEGKQANEDIIQSEDKEPINGVEYEEDAEEDEIDDDILGEGFDAAEDYLQELFGSFPFNAAAEGDEMQGADQYDGEYQIYEQYSDEGDDDFDDEEY
ncbi:general transcription factor 3C polypeptide 5-like [Dorcoceras hygrometricum]|uniref:General transcription factor 3C polypeptide 5-like n=1 Tax=Dorcoceras hygrometricum TaxID=472368 RepID=A0A2Z7CV15_9LAMI|nr:general transcription factor 3C polypeptide 5-like [Dorcoceras hygrometricum]